MVHCVIKFLHIEWDGYKKKKKKFSLAFKKEVLPRSFIKWGGGN